MALFFESVAPPMTTTKEALVALGANLTFGGLSPDRTILAAIAALGREGFLIDQLSNLYETPCFPAGAGPDYVNAAATIPLRQGQTAAGVLTVLHRVEAEFGRERLQRWGMRTLDLDLIAISDSVLPDLVTYTEWQRLAADSQRAQAPDQLILPHPRLQDRAFVLVPLADVAPDWCHPVLGQTIRQMLAALPQSDRDAVVVLKTRKSD